MSGSLESRRDGRVLRLTLNRPEKRNALNVELCGALAAALEGAELDHGVGCTLVTANGPAFCAGMDLEEVLQAGAGEINRVHEQLFTAGLRLTKPIVAAVHGAALGGGTGLAANAHIVIASDDATFGLTEIRLGLWPFLIFRAVSAAFGERRAVELSLTGRVFGAAEARELGLVAEVVAREALLPRAEAVAQAVSEFSPAAIRSGLTFVQEARGRNPREAAEIARNIRQQLFKSPDFREGVQAFLEKRKPRWPSIV